MQFSCKSRTFHYTILILAYFMIVSNVLKSSQYEYRLVPIKSIDRVGPSLGKMRQIRNSGHILCLKQGHTRYEFCKGAFRKLPQLSSNYTLINATTGNEFAYRIMYSNETYEKNPQIVFACGCPTDPIGVFLMGWINNEDAVVEVLDYQFSKTAPLEKYVFKGLPKDNIPLEDMRKQFLVSFEKGQNYLLQKYDQRMQQTAQ